MVTTANDTQFDLDQLFERQRANTSAIAQTTAAERIEKLKRLERYLKDAQKMQGLKDALYQDFKKSEVDVILTEASIVSQHAAHTRRNLRNWMKNQPVPGTSTLIGTSSYIQYEPKGVCLIIAPWNYPFNLALSPLVYAIAAGNTAILKPSEMTPHTSAFIKKMLNDLFSDDEVAVVEGDADTSTQLLGLPFDHIFFTGSPQVGKVVMAAAAKNLTSVTLELGGKSPVIIDETASMNAVVNKLVWGKLLNNGQTCIAPDYAIVHESRLKAFTEAYQKNIQALYPQGVSESPDYCRIVNDRHFARIKRLYDDAMAKGAEETVGGVWNAADRFIPPTVLQLVNEDMAIMEEEIFGPVLPVITYRTPEEIVAIVHRRPKPLTLYIGSNSRKLINYVLNHTSSGGAVINDFMLGYANPELPFGGVNNSGIGKYMGFYGFVGFSNEKAIVHRKWGTLSMIYPPYTPRVKWLVEMLQKWVV
jgi:aldehyde dehydrogenase (NAD+)